MTTTSGNDERGGRPDKVAQAPAEGLVYVSPGTVYSGAADDKISLRQIWQILWRGKQIVIATTIIFALGSVTYALLAKEIFRAEVLLVPATEQSAPMIGGQLGGLAALAGVSTGGRGVVEALAVLQSRKFARDFIEQLNLMPVFFVEDWDAEEGRWRENDPAEAPDIRDGVKFFRENILKVSEERTTGLVTLAIEWTDPGVAAEWAGILVRRLNDRLREGALQEAQTNVAYLQSEMAKTTLATLQESIGRLLESELPKLMLAKGNEEFAFKIVDPAVAPKQRVRPKRALTTIIGTMLGGLLGIFIVLVGHSGRAGTDS
ncbi:MAG: hypothetical protein E2O53_12665 [Gammaproteobacteria bacterium]|nr:MAG: hypothetical protein E2O53_12665 [Gammaproteobacteria bacterium]